MNQLIKKHHRLLKILTIVFICIIALLILVAFALPPFAKSYIENHSEEWTGRKIKIEALRVNPLTASLTIRGFTLFEKDKKTAFVAFKELYVNTAPLALITGTLHVENVHLTAPYARVTQDSTVFNFSDLLQRFVPQDSAKKDTAAEDTAKTAEKGSGLPFSIAIDDIQIQRGNVVYEDLARKSRTDLKNIGLAIPAVYFSGKNTDVGLHLNFGEGGSLGVKVSYNIADGNFAVALNLKRFALETLKPYLNDYLNYRDFTGYFSTDLKVKGNVAKPLESQIQDITAVDSLALTETDGQKISVAHIGLGLAEANVQTKRFRVDSIVVDGASAHFDLEKNGNNIQTLLSKYKPAPDTGKKDTVTPDARVASLRVTNTDFTFNDRTLDRPFSYKVTGIRVTADNLGLTEQCEAAINAELPGGGSANVKYTGVPTHPETFKAYLALKNVDLRKFTPYSLHYTGYPITAGTLAFASDNNLRDYNIKSENTIDIFDIEAGDKDKNAKPEYKVPLKLALYIVKDKDGKIDFDVPVKGNIHDPQFSYGRIILKTLVNLLVKVAVSPIRLLGNAAVAGANALGADIQEKDEIAFDPLYTDFKSEQYAKAARYAEIFKKYPKMKLTFTQYCNPKESVAAYRELKLKTEFYRQNSAKDTLNEIDRTDIAAIKNDDSAYVAFTAAHTEIPDAELEKELMEKTDARNAELLKTLRAEPGVTEKNVTVKNAPYSEMLRYKGDAVYKVEMDVE